MTRARNGAAPVARAGILWHVIPDDDDRGPSKTFPRCADGDELLARTESGEVVEVTVSRRHGCAFIGPDGEAVEADAIAVRPSRATRSGVRKAPFLNVQLPASEDEQRRFKAAAAEEGQAFSRWLLEAARAYELMGKREDAELTDEDWREIVRA